jgi:hypothetical protein
MNPFKNLTSYFFEIHFNIILPSTSRSYKYFLSYRSSDQITCIYCLFKARLYSR